MPVLQLLIFPFPLYPSIFFIYISVTSLYILCNIFDLVINPWFPLPTAPEVLAEQKAFPSSDIWSLGALIYLLLSGKSAFGGVDEEDTHQNILHVRYRYEHLGSNTTQEAIRFLMLIFKRDPR